MPHRLETWETYRSAKLWEGKLEQELGSLTDANADFLQQDYCFVVPRGARNGGVIVTNVNMHAT